MPSFVDAIIVIDDRSTDQTIIQTQAAAKKFKRKVVLIEHETNQGVGGAILSGFERAL